MEDPNYEKKTGWSIFLILAPIAIFFVLIMMFSPGPFSNGCWFGCTADFVLGFIGFLSIIFGIILLATRGEKPGDVENEDG
jgi:hypothetical protein